MEISPWGSFHQFEKAGIGEVLLFNPFVLDYASAPLSSLTCQTNIMKNFR